MIWPLCKRRDGAAPGRAHPLRERASRKAPGASRCLSSRPLEAQTPFLRLSRARSPGAAVLACLPDRASAHIVYTIYLYILYIMTCCASWPPALLSGTPLSQRHARCLRSTLIGFDILSSARVLGSGNGGDPRRDLSAPFGSARPTRLSKHPAAARDNASSQRRLASHRKPLPSRPVDASTPARTDRELVCSVFRSLPHTRLSPLQSCPPFSCNFNFIPRPSFVTVSSHLDSRPPAPGVPRRARPSHYLFECQIPG